MNNYLHLFILFIFQIKTKHRAYMLRLSGKQSQLCIILPFKKIYIIYSICCILISFLSPSNASYSVSSVQLLISSPAVERVILNFQFKSVLWCLSELPLLYFCINWWQCFQVSVVWNQAWNISTLEFHQSKNPGIIHLPKCWYCIKFPSHTPALGLSHHFLPWLMNLRVETRFITADSLG